MSGVAMKPCPWCGGEVGPTVEEGATFRWRRVTGCCAEGPEVRHDTLADDQDAAKTASDAAAIEAWNIRPVEDTLRAQLEAVEARHAATERDACRQAEQTNEWKSRAEAAEAECARLRHAGAMLANCAFNLAQRDHLSADERRSLDESRIAWDAAHTNEQQA